MNQLQIDSKVRHIGDSNFSAVQLREAIDASDSSILTNQVKYHPLHRQNDILAFGIENDIMVTANSPRGKERMVNHETVSAIGS